MKYDLNQLSSVELIKGFHGKMIHTEEMTLAFWDIKAGKSLPEHHHHHEQVLIMQEGEFRLTANGQDHILKPGDLYVLKGHVPHSGQAISDCKILDVFVPVREDYR